MVAAVEPARLELLGAKRCRDAAVREHRPLAVRVDERADDTALPFGRARDLDSACLEAARGEAAGVVVPPLSDEPRPSTELGSPRGDVRRLPACREVRPRRRVRAGRDRPG